MSSSGRSVYAQSLTSAEKTMNLSTFGYLFSELVSYHHSSITSVSDLETRLKKSGIRVGHRLLELISIKKRPFQREVTVLGILQFISGTVWTYLFGKNADALEKNTEQANAYMIRENEPITNHFISVPRDYGKLNVAAYLAGIIEGILLASSFNATVDAILVPSPESLRDKTVFLIKFDESTVLREASVAATISALNAQ